MNNFDAGFQPQVFPTSAPKQKRIQQHHFKVGIVVASPFFWG
jgi:hypothetical protein